MFSFNLKRVAEPIEHLGFSPVLNNENSTIRKNLKLQSYSIGMEIL
jgi:hypothetical protein